MGATSNMADMKTNCRGENKIFFHPKLVSLAISKWFSSTILRCSRIKKKDLGAAVIPIPGAQ